MLRPLAEPEEAEEANRERKEFHGKLPYNRHITLAPLIDSVARRTSVSGAVEVVIPLSPIALDSWTCRVTPNRLFFVAQLKILMELPYLQLLMQINEKQ